MQCSKSRLSQSSFYYAKGKTFHLGTWSKKQRLELRKDLFFIMEVYRLSWIFSEFWFYQHFNSWHSKQSTEISSTKEKSFNWNQDGRSQIYFCEQFWFWKQRWIKDRWTFWKFRIDSNLRQGSWKKMFIPIVSCKTKTNFRGRHSC